MPPENPAKAPSETLLLATNRPLFSNSETLTWRIARSLVLIRTSRLAEERSVDTLGKISRLAGAVLNSEPWMEVCFKSPRKKAPETEEEVVCNSTHPEEIPAPKMSFAFSALLFEGGRLIVTGLLIPAPWRTVPASTTSWNTRHGSTISFRSMTARSSVRTITPGTVQASSWISFAPTRS